MKKRRPRWWKKTKRYVEYNLIIGALWLIALPSRQIALRLAEFLGRIAFKILWSYRKQAIANLTLVFKDEKNHDEIRQIGESSFVHLAKNLVDFARFPGMGKNEFDRLVTVIGLPDFNKVFELNKGVIALTGHIGNWEMMAAWFAMNGYPVSVIGRRLFDKRLNEVLVKARNLKGINNIDRDSSLRTIWRVLKKGEIIGVLIDQDTKVENVVVEFFGYPARTPVGIAQLAIRTGTPVYPLAIHRIENDNYRVTFDKPIFPPENPKAIDEAAKDLTLQFNHALERLIKLDCAQWVWMHRRWRKKLIETYQTD